METKIRIKWTPLIKSDTQCKYFPCTFNGRHDCAYPLCSKYTKGNSETCYHSNNHKGTKFGVPVIKCKTCASWRQIISNKTDYEKIA